MLSGTRCSCRWIIGRVVAKVDAGVMSRRLTMNARRLPGCFGASLPCLGLQVQRILMLEPFDFSCVRRLRFRL